ncbi:glycerophosphoryl diester phosphodiesterase [Emticicia oligotrophica DSM 17448]|uniref:Glycerophosphoryl diester phosphodiesterase n=2 Tax=Emticicia TaxID=312278 RepID=A0ABM5MYE4_EMTOG|nr:glycerophosphoryl diester phosphodiesterase [Emticicia oligotrophica DSM 17448]
MVLPSVLWAQSKVIFPKTKHNFIVIAHRGFHIDAPENTIEALKKAIELGVDYVEVDVRSTLEGVPVVMHDANLERTTDGTGKVSTISTVDFQNLKIKDTAINPPTFSSFLMEASGKINLYLDIKDASPEKIISMLDKYQMRERVIIYCSASQVIEWKKLAPSIPVMTSPFPNLKSPTDFESFLLSFPASALDGNIRTYKPDVLNKLTEINVPVWLDVLGKDDNEQGWKMAIDLNINALQTDNPKALIDYLTKNNLRK